MGSREAWEEDGEVGRVAESSVEEGERRSRRVSGTLSKVEERWTEGDVRASSGAGVAVEADMTE